MDKWLTKATLLCGMLVVASLASWVSAVEVADLYRVKIGVADQSPKTRWEAALAGFKEVLIRKSGSQEVLTAEEIKQAYSKVTAYLQRFEYSSVPAGSQGESLPYILQLDFEPRLVDELIQAAGMPIWGSNRPITILWLATEENFQRSIIKESVEPESFSELIKQNGQRRGVPLILPLMDLEDELNVTISDIWGRFNSTVVSASERYAADAIVTGRIHQVGEEWQAKLSYINQEEQRIVEFSQVSKAQLIESLADRVAELLCQKYCVVEMADSHAIKLQVSGIGNFASFKASMAFLQGLSSIRKVEVDSISGTHIRYNVALLGDLQSVKDGIELGNRLIVETEPKQDPFAPIKEGNSTNGMPAHQTAAGSAASQSNQQNLVANTFGQPGLVDDVNGANLNAVEAITEEPMTLYYRWVE